MRRYDLVTNYRAGGSIEEMERADEYGDWVRWEDVEAERAALTSLIAEMRKAAVRWDYEQHDEIDVLAWADRLERLAVSPAKEPQP
jgi:hypothetical protein